MGCYRSMEGDARPHRSSLGGREADVRRRTSDGDANPTGANDDGEVASPDLRLKLSRQPEKWQRLYRQQIFDYLQGAQTNSPGLVTCAGMRSVA